MKVIDVSRKDRILKGTGSSGCQMKWVANGKFYKLSLLGYEHVAEVLVSELMHCSSLSPTEYVIYSPCLIREDGKVLGQGCYCESFLKDDEYEVSVANILDSRLAPYSISYDELLDVLYDETGDYHKSYIDKILALDTITRNDDRHFRNISFIRDINGLRPAPIFDNGGACMSDCISYPMSENFDILWKSIYAKPFSLTFGKDLQNNTPIGINVDMFMSHYEYAVDNPISKRAFDVIIRGLKESEGVAWVKI